jgi:hypothetical protein
LRTPETIGANQRHFFSKFLLSHSPATFTAFRRASGLRLWRVRRPVRQRAPNGVWTDKEWQGRIVRTHGNIRRPEHQLVVIFEQFARVRAWAAQRRHTVPVRTLQSHAYAVLPPRSLGEEQKTDRKGRAGQFVVGRRIAVVRAVGEEGVVWTAVGGGGRLVLGLNQVQRAVVGHHEIIEHIILEEGRALQGDVHVTGHWGQVGEILWLFFEHCNTSEGTSIVISE